MAASAAAAASSSSGETNPLLEGGAEEDPEEAQVPAIEELGETCLMLLQAVSAATMGAGALVMAVNLYVMCEFSEPIRMYAVRSYNVIFGVFIILAEAERPALLLDYFKFLKVWTAKGLFIAFVGILTLDTEMRSVSLLQTVCALLTFSLGGLYFVLGLLCLRTYRDARKAAAGTPEAKSSEEPASDAVDAPASAEEAPSDAPSWMDPAKDPRK
ncbi:hypothetical protein CTAYLR_000705 [Chrysophaeum taylorii]|uniref:COPI associated protein n=1 Tax=Chrysophaeum taylorii TaxID=2483200 RepID=A0AAD7U9J8_9STRA|nr:hypothetical protein CTAYLR_000705 [Chrysophaeum taylorii]